MYTKLSNGNLRVVQHNVLTWAGRERELELVYRDLGPDVILLNSTCHGARKARGKSQTEVTVRIEGYTCYESRDTGVVADGWAIGVRRGLPHKVLWGDDGMLGVEVSLVIGPVRLYTTYIKPRDSVPPADLLDVMRRNIPTFLVADMNIKWRGRGDTHSNGVGRSVGNLIEAGVATLDGPDFPTFMTAQGGGTAPDSIISNCQCYLIAGMEPGPHTSSDHLPIVLEIGVSKAQHEPETYPFLDEAMWKEGVESMDWSGEAVTNVGELRKAIELKFNQLADLKKRCTTRRERTLKSHLRWSVRGRTLLRMLQALCAAFELERDEDLWKEILTVRSELKRECEHAFNERWKEYMSKIQWNDATEFWRQVGRIRQPQNQQTHCVEHQGEQVQGVRLAEIHEDMLRRQFSIPEEDNLSFDREFEAHVGRTLRSNITSDDEPIKQWHVPGDSGLITREILLRMKQGAPGPSGIGRNHLVAIDHRPFWEWWSNAFKHCCMKGVFPEVFRRGEVVMIPKNRRPTNASQFRPITLLEVLGKVLERMLKMEI